MTAAPFRNLVLVWNKNIVFHSHCRGSFAVPVLTKTLLFEQDLPVLVKIVDFIF